jgi:KDO2-lipid IV(A) lauroyltransferase
VSARRKTGLTARLGCLAVRALILCSRLTPLCLMRAAAGLLGRLGYLLDGRHRRTALEAVARAFPEKNAAEHRAVVRGCYRHLCLAALEFARLAWLPRERVAELWALTDEQVRFFEDVADRKDAVIFITGHVGLWEMCGLGSTARGFPLYSIARPLDNPGINEIVNRVRERFGQRILAKRGALRAALRALKEGISVGMLLDQDAGRRGVFVPLFGRPASTLPTAAEIALRSGARLICASAWRDEAAGVHRLRIGRIIEPGKWEGPRDERYRAEVERITAEYTLEIENAVREHPEQWLWLHRRWKTRPPEEQTPSTAETAEKRREDPA